MTPRTKFILTAIVAFFLGMMFRGSGGTVGRYQFSPTIPNLIIDTTSGETFQYSAENHAFKRLGSLPWR
ncbi:MAG: hypothetical protein WCH43_12685 [Verrucomicrobiota bacterium]